MNCQCCGKIVETRDNFPLHTSCMRNHANHLDGIKSSRCKSAPKRTTVQYERIPDDFEGDFEALANPETYYAEAKRVHSLGIRRAGVFGSVCPKCLREDPADVYAPSAYAENPWLCNCDAQTISPARQSLEAHGLGHLKIGNHGRGNVAV